ncbi:hypothetical protein MGAST_21770 [Mycobacterium gastri 'Wayne']|nr:hypothetical protein MGAST_21770 [Mycobacterium gastri 'Wayne']
MTGLSLPQPPASTAITSGVPAPASGSANSYTL